MCAGSAARYSLFQENMTGHTHTFLSPGNPTRDGMADGLQPSHITRFRCFQKRPHLPDSNAQRAEGIEAEG